MSEIAVSHTSLLCRLGTPVLVLYYIYTYRDLGLRQLLFTELLPIFKLSIFSTGESRKPRSTNSCTYVRCIIKNHRPLPLFEQHLTTINNETVSTCNNNNNNNNNNNGTNGSFNKRRLRTSRTYLQTNGLFNKRDERYGLLK